MYLRLKPTDYSNHLHFIQKLTLFVSLLALT